MQYGRVFLPWTDCPAWHDSHSLFLKYLRRSKWCSSEPYACCPPVASFRKDSLFPPRSWLMNCSKPQTVTFTRSLSCGPEICLHDTSHYLRDDSTLRDCMMQVEIVKIHSCWDVFIRSRTARPRERSRLSANGGAYLSFVTPSFAERPASPTFSEAWAWLPMFWRSASKDSSPPVFWRPARASTPSTANISSPRRAAT